MATRNDLFPSKYLKHADLGGAEITLTINSLTIEEIGTDIKEKKPVLNFSNDEKMLVLNLTNYDTIAMGFGEETDNWKGKQITLYGDKARFGNKIVDCLRIRPVAAPTLDSVAPAQAAIPAQTAIPAQAAAPVAAPAVAQAAAPAAQTVGELIDDAIPDFTAKQAVLPQ